MPKREFVSISYPTAGQTVASPVDVRGECSPPNMVITVSVELGTTSKGTHTVTAASTAWNSSFTLSAGQNYTATATGTGGTDSKSFSVS